MKEQIDTNYQKILDVLNHMKHHCDHDVLYDIIPDIDEIEKLCLKMDKNTDSIVLDIVNRMKNNYGYQEFIQTIDDLDRIETLCSNNHNIYK